MIFLSSLEKINERKKSIKKPIIRIPYEPESWTIKM